MRTVAILAIILAASPAFADFAPSLRFDTADVRAMGGVSGVSGTPAAAAADNKNVSIYGLIIDLRGSLSAGLDAYSWAKDAMDFKDHMGDLLDPANIMAQRDKLAALAARVPSAFDIQGRVEVARVQLGNRRIGYFLAGAYAEGFGGLRLSLPDPKRIGVDVAKGAIDLGQSVALLEAAGSADTGGRIGYGRLFDLAKGISLAGGAQVRVFQRWLVRPYRIGMDAKINGGDSVRVPDFAHETAIGGAADLSAILLVDNRRIAGRLGLEVNGIGAVGYASGTEREPMDFAIGAIVQPLRFLGYRRWEVGNEIHAYEDGRVSYHVGTSITWGGRWLNISPRIGGAIADRRVFGETRNAFTGGFLATLGILQVAGVCELYSGGYDAGIRLGFGN